MLAQRPTRPALRIAFLAIFLAAFLRPDLALGETSTPVVVESLQFAPTAIDTSNGSVLVTLKFNAKDDVAGINYIEAAFVDPSGVSRRSVSARFAPVQSAANSVSFAFPQFSESGTWTLASVFLSDTDGNTLVLDTESLASRGFRTRLEVTSTKDTVSPRLTALAFAPAEVDTNGGPADLKVNYTATDDLSGVSYIELGFVSPSGVAKLGGSVKLEASRSASKSINVTFPRFSEAGSWTLSTVFLADAAGNTSLLNTENLAGLGFPTSVDVKTTADTRSPSLSSFHFTPQGIDTSQGPATVKVDFTATDDISGVKSIEVVFVSPSGRKLSGSASFSPATQIANSVNVNFPVLSESGQWTLSVVMLADAAGNTLLLDAEGVERLGLQRIIQVGARATDTIPPTLTEFRLTPEAIDTTNGPATVKVELVATDNLSGVQSVEVVLASPSGSVRQSGSTVFAPDRVVAGWVEVTFPRASEPGIWKVSSVKLLDVAGNSLVLDEYAMASKTVKVH